MTARILAAASPGEVRVAVEQDGALQDYAIWRPGSPDGVGDLYRGRVISRVPALAGAFVALDGQQGFLPDSAGAAAMGAGDVVTVRVTRAAQGGKGPRLRAEPAAEGSRRGLLARGPGPLLELAAHYPDAPVLVDSAALAARLRPSLGDRLDRVSEAFDDTVETGVAALAQPEIELAGGARLSIHPTPALVAIDVDLGAGAGSRAGKTVAHVAANQALLPALARQIRLRSLSGAILVDFAGLPARRRPALGPALTAALAADPLRPRLLGFTALGLAEIVRPRVHPPLHEILAGPLAAGLTALRRIAAELAAAPHRRAILRAAPAVVSALEADGEGLADLAVLAGRPLILRADAALPRDGWVIEFDHG